MLFSSFTAHTPAFFAFFAFTGVGFAFDYRTESRTPMAHWKYLNRKEDHIGRLNITSHRIIISFTSAISLVFLLAQLEDHMPGALAAGTSALACQSGTAILKLFKSR